MSNMSTTRGKIGDANDDTPKTSKRGPYRRSEVCGDDVAEAKVPRTTLWRRSKLGNETLATGHDRVHVVEFEHENHEHDDEDHRPTPTTSDDLGNKEHDDHNDEGVTDNEDADLNVGTGITDNTENDIDEGEGGNFLDEGCSNCEIDNDADTLEEPSIYDTTPTDPNNLDDQPLYANARLTVGTSMLLIAVFVARHGLTGECLLDLLSLIEMHCLAENLCRTTLWTYHKYFENLDSPIQCHYFCGSCEKYFGVKKPAGNCPLCDKDDAKYFIILPLAEQLKSLLSRQDVFKALKTKRKRATSTSIEDVYDGLLYKSHFDDDGYFHGSQTSAKGNEIHLSIQMNSDGVSLFHSSTFGLWPVYAVINELPFSMRFRRENRLFIGLWFGRTKPNMNILLNPMARDFQEIQTSGIQINGHRCRALLFSVVADAPARCLFLTMNQFNGAYGCPCCYQPGTRLQVSAAGFARVYPYDSAHANGFGKVRTSEETIQIGEDVDEEYFKSNRNQPDAKFGVKGSSVLSHFPGFDLIRGTTIDYMHCAFLGITKMMIGLWTDSSHRAEDWSIRKQLKYVNSQLLSIQPPNFVTRVCRSFDDLAHWKASEYKAFALYYSLPVMVDTLPAVYFEHWLLFAYSIYLLSSSSITQSELNLAESMLKMFCLQMTDLYGDKYCTFNVHCLLHLVDKVRDLGPLWCHSCFYFEDFNGELRRLFHGTQCIEMQIMSSVAIQQKLPDLTSKLISGSAEEMLYRQMVKSRRFSKAVKITTHFSVIGFMSGTILSDSVKQLVEHSVGQADCVRSFYRILMHDGSIIHSLDYTGVQRRNSYTICYEDEKFGFVKVYLECVSNDGISHYVAIIKLLDKVSSPLHPISKVHHFQLVSESDKYAAVPIISIKSQCLFIKGSEETQVHYVVKSANKVEKD